MNAEDQRELVHHAGEVIVSLLPDEQQPHWMSNVTKATTQAPDISAVWPQFALFLLVDDTEGMHHYVTTNDQREVVERVIGLYQQQLNGTMVPRQVWSEIIDQANVIASKTNAGARTSVDTAGLLAEVAHADDVLTAIDNIDLALVNAITLDTDPGTERAYQRALTLTRKLIELIPTPY